MSSNDEILGSSAKGKLETHSSSYTIIMTLLFILIKLIYDMDVHESNIF